MVFKRKEKIGSSKKVVETDELGVVKMVDLGATSVVDRGAIPGFVSKDVAISRTKQAEAMFLALRYYGINTHFVAKESDTSLRVRESRVSDLPLLSGFAHARMLGLEVLCRLRATRKFCDRFKRGEIPAGKLRLHPGDVLIPGTRFAVPFVEFSTKWRPGGDVYLSDLEAAKLTGCSDQEISEVLTFGEKVTEVVGHVTHMTGYETDDFKIEVAKEYALAGRLMVIDGITMDETGMHKNGKPYGKNPIRFYYREKHPRWVKDLKAAQAEYPEHKEKWPPYPPLPDWLKKEHISKHQEVARDWSGFVAQNCK